MAKPLRLGAIQRQIVDYLRECGPNGGYIGNAPKSGYLAGYTWEEITPSLDALIRRGIVKRRSVARWVLVEAEEHNHDQNTE
jgi:hypothetical protein